MQANLRLGRLNASAQAFQHASTIDPTEPLVACRLGHVLAAAGEHAAAMVALETALGAMDQGLAMAQCARRDLGESLLEHGRAMAMQGAQAKALQLWARAEEVLTECLTREPTWASCWKTLADVEMERGNNDEARAHYQRVVCLEPWQALAWYDLGRLLEMEGGSDGGAGFVLVCG